MQFASICKNIVREHLDVPFGTFFIGFGTILLRELFLFFFEQFLLMFPRQEQQQRKQINAPVINCSFECFSICFFLRAIIPERRQYNLVSKEIVLEKVASYFPTYLLTSL